MCRGRGAVLSVAVLGEVGLRVAAGTSCFVPLALWRSTLCTKERKGELYAVVTVAVMVMMWQSGKGKEMATRGRCVSDGEWYQTELDGIGAGFGLGLT